jgi:hypothetical protein
MTAVDTLSGSSGLHVCKPFPIDVAFLPCLSGNDHREIPYGKKSSNVRVSLLGL